jgi:hypothetical protein
MRYSLSSPTSHIHFRISPKPLPLIMSGVESNFEVSGDLYPASASASSPPAYYLRLYRHALESIFAFATLGDLHSLCSVCRHWLQAVSTMRSIDATAPLRYEPEYMALLCASRLILHIAVAGSATYPEYLSLTGDKLSLLLRSAPRLRELHWQLDPYDLSDLPQLSGQLKMLQMKVSRSEPEVIAQLVPLQQLESLTLKLDGTQLADINFASLQRMRSLQQFSLLDILEARCGA